MTKLRNYGIITGKTLNTSFGFDEESENCQRLKDLLFNCFSGKKGVFYSTCEAGLGIYCCEAVMKSNNALFCVIPYENQPQKWSADFRDRYFALHQFATGVKTISRGYTEQCQKEAEKFIADSCDEIFLILSKSDALPEIAGNSKKVTIIDCDDLTIRTAN